MADVHELLANREDDHQESLDSADERESCTEKNWTKKFEIYSSLEFSESTDRDQNL